jgi:hypothetical protein
MSKKNKPTTQPVTIPVIATPSAPIKIDLGCGPRKQAGFIGVDTISFPGVDIVTDLNGPWPWKDRTVDEAYSSHCIEHFNAMQRVHFVNELYRVMKVGSKATLIAPHWASCRAYGDPTHQWPPISEFAFFYWSKAWRDANAPHTDSKNLKDGFSCDFTVTWGYSLEPGVAMRNQEYQQMAMTYYKEACQDIIATLVKV